MNSRFHKAQAEALIMQANELNTKRPLYWQDDSSYLVELAKVHATLATIEDNEG